MDLGEFLEVMARKVGEGEGKDEIAETFAEIDKDGDGFINR